MFCGVKTAVADPIPGSGGRRAFLVLVEGKLERYFGYLVKMRKMERKVSWMPFRRCLLDPGRQ